MLGVDYDEEGDSRARPSVSFHRSKAHLQRLGAKAAIRPGDRHGTAPLHKVDFSHREAFRVLWSGHYRWKCQHREWNQHRLHADESLSGLWSVWSAHMVRMYVHMLGEGSVLSVWKLYWNIWVHIIVYSFTIKGIHYFFNNNVSQMSLPVFVIVYSLFPHNQ